MPAPTPIRYVWDGECHRPASPFWQRRADEQFVVGEPVDLLRHDGVSTASRGHYFAQLKEIWTNLSDEDAAQFPTVDHLRKHALIATGYRDERKIVCASVLEARKVAAFIRPLDEYALVVARGEVVVVATAKSQSASAMGKHAFQKSKTDVLEWGWARIGVTPQEGAANTGRAA